MNGSEYTFYAREMSSSLALLHARHSQLYFEYFKKNFLKYKVCYVIKLNRVL